MSDLVFKILKQFGLPTLLAVGLGALLAWQTMKASEERVNYTALMIDQVADLREKVARLEEMCRR